MASGNMSRVLNFAGLADKKNKFDALRFITSVSYTANVAKMVNNITFLYDPNWTYGEYEEATLPFCFYFVRRWEEVGESQISQRPMLFYNSGGAGQSQRAGAVLDVVADNVVLAPKSYRMDVLLPFAPDACLDQYQLDNGMMVNCFDFSMRGAEASNALAVTNAVINNSVSLLRMLFKVFSVNMSLSSVTNLILSQEDVNKASLDGMRAGRGILKMKMWNGWKFKYVMLKNVSISKSGEYKDFYEGSITVQEVPIVNVYQATQIKSVLKSGKSVFEKIASTSLKKAAEAAMGAMSKANSPGAPSINR